MFIVGELFDRHMAITLTNEMLAKGMLVRMSSLSSSQGEYFQILMDQEEGLDQARDYFRVRMGLPGPPPEVDPEWERLSGLKMGPVSKFLLFFSIALFFTRFKPEVFQNILSLFFFNTPQGAPFESLKQGELWRLVTPIFLHFNFFHILFNGMWIKELGKIIENEKGSPMFLSFTLVVAIFSNTLQYLASGPQFGGLSGLVYGLLGYLWVYGSLREGEGFRLPKRDVTLMVGWYFLCLTGLIGNIANIAHGAGLAAGMFWGLFPWKAGHLKDRLKFLLLALFFSVGTYLIEIIKINFI